jgi:hypothetical protein
VAADWLSSWRTRAATAWAESKSKTGGTNSLNDGINRYQGSVDTIVQLFRGQVSGVIAPS